MQFREHYCINHVGDKLFDFDFISFDDWHCIYEVGYRKGIRYKELAAKWRDGSDGSVVAAYLPLQETC